MIKETNLKYGFKLIHPADSNPADDEKILNELLEKQAEAILSKKYQDLTRFY